MTTKSTPSFSSEKMLQLPILKHFDAAELTLTNNDKKFRPGEKQTTSVLTLIVFAALGYLTWVYVLPPVFKAIGELLALAITAIGVVLLILLAPLIFKMLRAFARHLNKLFIKYNPFGELEIQKEKMKANRENFKAAKAKIKSLKSQMETDAVKSEQEAKDFQQHVLELQKKAETIKIKMSDMERNMGDKAKETDEYVELQSTQLKVLSEAQRVAHQLEQSSNFVQKYGVRANVMGKLDRKLTLVQTAMDIKISDFETSISMLRKEYEFAESAKNATAQAKSAMLFTKSWELDYALDVVTNTIATDISITQENLTDLDTLTSKYSLDSDELYAKLDTLTDKIKTGQNTVPDAAKFNNPNYKLTSQDKANSGGFSDLF
jgi:hypothetical protein